MQMTEEEFEKATGAAPIQDDLERVNCPKAGLLGHAACGWNKSKNLPVFMVGQDNESEKVC